MCMLGTTTEKKEKTNAIKICNFFIFKFPKKEKVSKPVFMKERIHVRQDITMSTRLASNLESSFTASWVLGSQVFITISG